MKRSTPSSFKQPPRKKQKTQSDEIAVLKRKVNKINRAIEVKWYETSVFQPMAYVTSNGVDLALYQRSLVDMGAGDSVITREGAKIRTQRIKLSCTFWPQAQQIGPTQVLCYIVKDKQCNASSAICPYNTGFGVWSDDGGVVYPGNALPNPLQASRYTILKWKKFNINPQVAMDYEPTTGNTSLLVPKAINFDWDIKHEATVNYILTNSGNDSITSNNISFNVVCWADHTFTNPSVMFNAKVFFTDA